MNTPTSRPRILIADDEPLFLQTTGQLLRKAGYDCECVADGNAALRQLASQPFDLIISDLNMPGNLKLELLRQGRTEWPHIPLIVITGVPSLPTAIESVRLGIADYLLKPVKYEDLLASIRRVLAHRPSEDAPPTAAEQSEPDEQGDKTSTAPRFPEIIGQAKPMQDLLEILDRVTRTDANLLISGESGTGKEVVARAVHAHSRRQKRHFQVIDCTAIPEALFESVLFGHAKGSFTGAVQDQEGLLRRCDQGTAFFDEVGELPLPSQAKLLRAVQEQAFTPVGKSELIQVDTRFICATNRDLEVEVSAGNFRRDLFYRLGVIHLELPPLRDRGDDVLLLAQHFLSELCPPDRKITGFSQQVADAFRRYSWPGNVRELRNVVERAIALTQSEFVQLEDLPRPLQEITASPSSLSSATEISREEALDAADYQYLRSLLEKHGGNIAQAARQAGLSRQGLHKILTKHGIQAADFRT